MAWGNRWRALGGVTSALTAVVAVVLWGLVERLDATCERQRADAKATLDWHHRGVVRGAVLGDSWSTGSGAPAWPEMMADELDLDLRVASFGGSGYLNGSACGDQVFAARIDEIPVDAQVVVIAGGVNDTAADPKDLEGAARLLVDAVAVRAPGAELVVLGVPRVDLISDEATARSDAALRLAAGEAFVDVRGWDVELLADRIHPSEAGHVYYAEHVAAVVRERLRSR